MFCPPRELRLPPTNAICAAPHQAPNSPMASTNSTGAVAFGFSIGRRTDLWSVVCCKMAIARRSSVREAAAALPVDAGFVEQARDGIKTLGMTRHENQPQPRMFSQ